MSKKKPKTAMVNGYRIGELFHAEIAVHAEPDTERFVLVKEGNDQACQMLSIDDFLAYLKYLLEHTEFRDEKPTVTHH